MTAPKYLFTDDNSEALDELEKTQEEFQIFLNDLYTRYPLPEINEETGEPYTEEEKIDYLIKNYSINPTVWFQNAQLKKEREEERKAAAFTPLGMPREIIVDGEVVNTYDFLVETMGFEPYTEGSALNILDGLSSVNELKNLQQQLKDAGYLQAGTYNPGFVNTATTQAVERLLGDSNNSGKKWNNYLIDVLINPKFDTSDLPSEPDLDYNELGNTVVNSVRNEIKRDPTKEEFDILLGILAGYEIDEFEQTVSSLGPKYKKQTTTVGGFGSGGVEVETGEIIKVDSDVKIEDAGEKFKATVREMFKPTKDLNQRREQSKNVVNLINRSVAGLGSIGG